MHQAHIKAILEGVIPELKAAIDIAQKPLLDRIECLEKRSPEKGEPGTAGKDGSSVTVDDVAPMILSEVSKAVAAMPAPKDGEPGLAGKDGETGADGSSVTVDDVAPLIVAEVQKAVAALPVPKDGEVGPAGKDGKDGRDGVDGHDGVSLCVEDAAPFIVEQITKQIAAIPVPTNGKDGADGRDGKSVSLEDVAPLIERAVDKRLAALPPAECGEVGPAGKDGPPGRDGRDASDIPMIRGFIKDEVQAAAMATFRTLSVATPDDGRTFVFGLDVFGEPIKHEIKTALVLDNGVWRPESFKKGAGVSFGGSFFIAQEDTTDKPETSKAWRLAVKRGRDGRDGKPGTAGERGEKGERGEAGPRGFGG